MRWRQGKCLTFQSCIDRARTRLCLDLCEPRRHRAPLPFFLHALPENPGSSLTLAQGRRGFAQGGTAGASTGLEDTDIIHLVLQEL